MGALERHYIESKGLFGQEEDDRGYRKSKDVRIPLPTLYTRYASPYYLRSMESGKPQVVVKIISRAKGVAAVNRLGDYISRDIAPEDSRILMGEGHEIEENEYLSLEDESGCIYATKSERRALIQEWSKDFKGREAYKKQEWKKERLKEMVHERNQLQAKIVLGTAEPEEQLRYKYLSDDIERSVYRASNGKTYDLEIRVPKDTTHIILSVGGRPENHYELNKATYAVREFLSQNFGSLGHRYLFAAHNDTDNLHYHVIVKNTNEFDKNALRFDRADLFLMRQSFAQELEARGFERAATLRKDRSVTLEKIARGLELIHQNQTWYQHSLSKGTNSGFDAFTYRARIINKTNFLLQAITSQEKQSSVFEISTRSDLSRVTENLKKFRKSITKIKPTDLEREKVALQKLLLKDSKLISSKISRIEGFSYDEMQKAIKRKQEHGIKSASVYLDAHSKRLKQAGAELTDKQSKEVLNSLSEKASLNKELVKELSKPKTKSKSKSKSKDRGIEFD